MQEIQANKYGRIHVELINGSPRQILKGIRKLHRQSETSTQLDSTSLFRNSLPSPEIEKSLTLNCESIEHLQKLSEIKKNYKKKVDSNEKIANILYIDKVLLSKIFSEHSNISDRKSSSNTLKKVVEIRNGKRFVRMECVTECHLNNTPQMYFSKAHTNDIDLEYNKKKPISEYDYRIAERNPCSNFVHEDKFQFEEQDLVLPIKKSCVLNCENSLTNNQISSQTLNVLFKRFNSNTKVSPNNIYQTCLVLKNKPISYIWESTSQQFKHNTEFVFDMKHSSTSDTVIADEKLQISDKSRIKECRGTNLKHNILQSKVYESPQGIRKTTVSLSNEIQNRKIVLDSLEKTTDLFIKELFADDADDTDILSIVKYLELNFDRKYLFNFYADDSPEKKIHCSQGILYPKSETNKHLPCIWEDTSGNFKHDTELFFDMNHSSTSDTVTDEKVQIYDDNSSFNKGGLISLDSSQGIQYPELETNKLAKSLGSPRSTFIEEKSSESMKHLATIDESNKDIYTALFDNEKENVNDEIGQVNTSELSDYVDFHFKSSKFRNEYEENKDLLMLPSKSTLLLLDNLLFHLQNTYQIVEKEVHSWLLNSGTYKSDSEIQNFEKETSCESVRTLTDKNGCFGNSNYLKVRNTDTIKKCNERVLSSSVQFSNSYANNSLKKKEMISLHGSQDIQYSVKEMNKLANSFRNPKSAFTKEKSHELLKHSTTIDKSNEEYYISLLDNLKDTFNDKTSPVYSTEQRDSLDFHCKGSKYRNESEGNKNRLTLPYESTFLFIDNILFHLQNTYQIVEKEVQSWLLKSRTVNRDSKIHETSCETATKLADENGCSTNSNYLMRFKGRNADTTVRTCDEWERSCSNSDVLSLSDQNESESDLDDSESSLEGSFKQLRTDSRASTISSGEDSNDFDGIPRFSLPLRKSNEQKFHTKKTELCDEVSSKEWSWKNAETEISWKWTRKGRSFRSEEYGIQDVLGFSKNVMPGDLGIPEHLLRKEHGMQDVLGISKNVLPGDLGIPEHLLRKEHGMQDVLGISKNVLLGDLGIPEDLLRDFNFITLQSENTTDVERKTDVDKC